MKKKKAHKIANWFTDGLMKGVVILGVLVVGFYAYGQISFPSIGPNVTTGVVGQFIGMTVETFNDTGGNSGYSDFNDLCETGSVDVLDETFNIETQNNLGAHVCTPDELINSYNHGGAASPVNNYYKGTSATQFAWVNNGPPGFTANANDCKGWTDTASGNYGTAWNFKDGFGFLRECSLSAKPFACCK